MENWSVIVASAEKLGQPVASMDGLIAATAYTYHLLWLHATNGIFLPAMLR